MPPPPVLCSIDSRSVSNPSSRRDAYSRCFCRPASARGARSSRRLQRRRQRSRRQRGRCSRSAQPRRLVDEQPEEKQRRAQPELQRLRAAGRGCGEESAALPSLFEQAESRIMNRLSGTSAPPQETRQRLSGAQVRERQRERKHGERHLRSSGNVRVSVSIRLPSHTATRTEKPVGRRDPHRNRRDERRHHRGAGPHHPQRRDVQREIHPCSVSRRAELTLRGDFEKDICLSDDDRSGKQRRRRLGAARLCT